MKSLSKIVFLTLFISFTSNSSSNPPDTFLNIKNEYNKNIDLLNKSIINVLIRDQSEESVKLFKESIKAWEELKEKSCKVKSLGFKDSELLFNVCLLEYSESRENELKALNDFLDPKE